MSASDEKDERRRVDNRKRRNEAAEGIERLVTCPGMAAVVHGFTMVTKKLEEFRYSELAPRSSLVGAMRTVFVSIGGVNPPTTR